ncbi:VOC family protein [Sphingomonas sp. BIUV-7]|uniref:VOC family protein n=1 Tax=Sphingomonas natans TaxID=3063330 RepID=A0ABT8YAP6_9SPHN|nr:VOC family protein [Sphingomonas sp. BIUV-7]MDO6415062.1 VOC family protein [Sphingomonas sp. BIUV-7]
MDDLLSARPVAFVHVADRNRALAFYEGVLGLPLQSADPFGDFLDLGDALLRITVIPDYEAHPHPVLGWNVADVRATAAALAEQGVALNIYEGIGQDEDGIWTAPDGRVQVAWFLDPDGNVLSLSQT